MYEVKQPPIGLMYKGQVSKALQECLDMTDRPEEVDFHYLMGYRECLKDYQLIGEDKKDLREPNEMLMYDMGLHSNNLIKYINKARRLDADAEGYLKCLDDLGLLVESDEQ